MVETTFTWREYVPLFYVPIPQRHNPVVVVPTPNRVIIRVRRVRSPGADPTVISGYLSNEVINLINIFLSVLQSEVGALPRLSISVEVVTKSDSDEKIELNSSYLYVAITSAIAYFLSGEVSSEITESAKVLDRTIGVDDSVLALREFNKIEDGHAYIWRLNEGYIESDKKIILRLRKSCEYSMSYVESEFTDLITHLAGVATIRAFEKLLSGESLVSELRTLNAIWHILYGVPPPHGVAGGRCVFVKEINSCALYEILDVERAGSVV
ncbi:MAG: hypothetical protein J7L12_04840 [Desulfurococcales archaeon]|nr:hypothetical protein [Desulfurococcales archaeon]